MAREIEAPRSRHPVIRRAGAGVVLIAAAALVIHIVIGLVMAVFWVIVALAAVVAIIWALRNI
jgi:hypothetical protein